MRTLLLVLSIALTSLPAIVAAQPQSAETSQTDGPRQLIWPEMRLFERSIVGPYSLHQTMLAELLQEAETIGLKANRVVAMYPSNPGSVPADELQWSLALIVEGDQDLDLGDDSAYRLVEIEAQSVVAARTTMASMPQTSYQIDEWIRSEGLQQSGATRVISGVGSDGPTGDQVELIKPVAPAGGDGAKR